MRRRQFIAGCAALSVPCRARAQAGYQKRRIGVLGAFKPDDREGQARHQAFISGLSKLGWDQGRNLEVDVRWANSTESIQATASELLDTHPDAILVSNVPFLRALQQLTQKVPVVFAQVIDPLAQGFVSSLAHPGGNITGFTDFVSTMPRKWLDLIRTVAPGTADVLLIYHPETTPRERFIRPVEDAAASHGINVESVGVSQAEDIRQAFAHYDRHRGRAGLFVMPSFPTAANRRLIVDLAASGRVPAIYPYRYFATIGGLLSYGIDTVEPYRRAASYIDRILKGANPGDLPVQQPTEFVLTINLRTAGALGLSVPQSLLAIADEIIDQE